MHLHKAFQNKAWKVSQSPLVKEFLQRLWCKCRQYHPLDALCQGFVEVHERAVWLKDVKFNEEVCIARASGMKD